MSARDNVQKNDKEEDDSPSDTDPRDPVDPVGSVATRDERVLRDLHEEDDDGRKERQTDHDVPLGLSESERVSGDLRSFQAMSRRGLVLALLFTCLLLLTSIFDHRLMLVLIRFSVFNAFGWE